MTHSPRHPAAKGDPSSGPPRWALVVPWVLVGLACVCNALGYAHELFVGGPDTNDHVFHYALIERSASAASGSSWDPWVPYWGQGFPVMRYYQHLPHMSVVAVHGLMGGLASLFMVFKSINFAALVALPLCVFWGARLLGMRALDAGWSALCSCLLATDGLSYAFGYQLAAFSWGGAGLFPQLVACCLLPLALGTLHSAVSRGRGYARALVFMSALWLSHLVIGYVACLLGLFTLIRGDLGCRRRSAFARLACLYGATGVCVAYLIVPTLLDSSLLWRSLMEDATYWDSHGAGVIAAAMARGQLFDGGGVRVLTALVALGFAVSLVPDRWGGSSTHRFLALTGLFSLAVFAGRPTWGAVLDLLPASADLPLHRFIVPVHLIGLLLAGVGMGWLWRRMGWRRTPARALGACLGTAMVLALPASAAWQRATENQSWHRTAAEAFEVEGPTLGAAMAELRSAEASRPGRAYGGASWDGGADFRVATVPVAYYWAPNRLPAISYMFHTMGRNSELEPRFDATRRDHYDLFNVRYVLAPSADRLPAFATPFAARAGLISAAVETRGYFDVVDCTGVVDTSQATAESIDRFHAAFVAGDWHAQGRFPRVAWRHGPDSAVSRPAVTWQDVSRPADPAGPPLGRVLESGREEGAYQARVDVFESATVLFRMSYHPGWQAHVDGDEADVIMLAPSYMGIPVSPGQHDVVLTYRPSRAASPLRWLGLLVVLGTWLGERRWARRQRGEAR